MQVSWVVPPSEMKASCAPPARPLQTSGNCSDVWRWAYAAFSLVCFGYFRRSDRLGGRLLVVAADLSWNPSWLDGKGCSERPRSAARSAARSPILLRLQQVGTV